MKEIKLTQGKVVLVDDEDFDRVSQLYSISENLLKLTKYKKGKVMSPRNRVYRIFDLYKARLSKRVDNKSLTKSNRTKLRVLEFYLKNGRWPKRNSENKRERSLGYSFENYVAKESCSYDSTMRRLVMALGRKSNFKRKHNVAMFKQEIINFMKEHGRVPTTYSGELIEGEARLRSKLDYYTEQRNDMTLLGEIYKYDKCHKSGIPIKYRSIINQSLEVNKPLIRIVK